MKGVIIYKGKYGATAEYAHYLGEILNLPIYDQHDVIDDTLKTYDYIILGTSIYVGKLLNAKWIKRYSSILKNKKLFMFVVCGTPPTKTETIDEILAANIQPDIIKKLKTFFLKGRMIMRNLSWWDRFILRMGASRIKDPVQRKVILTDMNGVKKENLVDLINAITTSLPEDAYSRLTSHV